MSDRDPPPVYAGFVTRAVAIILDLVLINVIAAVAGGVVSLIASLFGHTGGVNVSGGVALSAAWVVWVAGYFVVFWTLTGQTPGNRVMRIRVTSESGDGLRIRRSIGRFGALILAALPLGAGFLPVLVDPRRRGLHDKLAGTEVKWVAPDESDLVLFETETVPAAPPQTLEPHGAVPARSQRS